jgi:hypothetical protein
MPPPRPLLRRVRRCRSRAGGFDVNLYLCARGHLSAREVITLLKSACDAAAVLLIGASAAPAATVDRFSAFFAFGDSLSDSGNLDGLVRSVAGQPIPRPDVVDGRLTNGPVWAEHGAADFARRDLPTGNFAFIGANAAADGPPTPAFPELSPLIPSIPQQVAMFAQARPELGGRAVAAHLGGADDLFFGGIGSPDVEALARDAARGVADSARALGGLGVEDVVRFSLPDLGLTPAYALFQPQLRGDPPARGMASPASIPTAKPSPSICPKTSPPRSGPRWRAAGLPSNSHASPRLPPPAALDPRATFSRARSAHDAPGQTGALLPLRLRHRQELISNNGLICGAACSAVVAEGQGLAGLVPPPPAPGPRSALPGGTKSAGHALTGSQWRRTRHDASTSPAAARPGARLGARRLRARGAPARRTRQSDLAGTCPGTAAAADARLGPDRAAHLSPEPAAGSRPGHHHTTSSCRSPPRRFDRRERLRASAQRGGQGAARLRDPAGTGPRSRLPALPRGRRRSGAGSVGLPLLRSPAIAVTPVPPSSAVPGRAAHRLARSSRKAPGSLRSPSLKKSRPAPGAARVEPL